MANNIGWYVLIGFSILVIIGVIIAAIVLTIRNRTVTGGCCTTNGCVIADEKSCFGALGGFYLGDNTTCNNVDCTLGCCIFQANQEFIPKALCNQPGAMFSPGQQCVRNGFLPGDVVRLFNTSQNGWLVYCSEGPSWCTTFSPQFCNNSGTLCPGSYLAITTANVPNVPNIDQWTVIVNNSDPTIISLLNSANGQYLLTTTCNGTFDAAACNGSFDGNVIEVNGLSSTQSATQFKYIMMNPTAENPTVMLFDVNSNPTLSRGIISIPAFQLAPQVSTPPVCNISDAGVIFSGNPCAADVWQVTFVNKK